MAKYLVKESLDHNLKRYDIGSEVELTEEEAGPLQTLGVVGDAVQGAQPGGDPGGSTPMKAADLIALIAVAETNEAVDTLLGADTRTTVIAAADKRRAELAG
jgi:hypothetical protein